MGWLLVWDVCLWFLIVCMCIDFEVPEVREEDEGEWEGEVGWEGGGEEGEGAS